MNANSNKYATYVAAIKQLGINYELKEQIPVSIGRKGYGADIEIDHDMMSRSHAELKIENGRLKVFDKFSKNGVLINNLPITPGGWHEFNANDKLSIVGFCFTFSALKSVSIPVNEEKAPDIIWSLEPSAAQDYFSGNIKPSEPASIKNDNKSIYKIFKKLIEEKTPIKIGTGSNK